MTYDEEFLNFIKKNKIDIKVIVDYEKFSSLLEENFPFGLNKINWKDVPKSIHEHIVLSDEYKAIKKVKQFIHENILGTGINIKEEVIILSDGALENTYQCSLADICEIVAECLFLPQHTYIVPLDCSWCLNYTFEDYIYFGKSPARAEYD